MTDWRCLKCRKLLAKLHSPGRLHIRISGGCQYTVSLPVSSTCPRCGTLNEVVEQPADGPRAQAS